MINTLVSDFFNQIHLTLPKKYGRQKSKLNSKDGTAFRRKSLKQEL